MFVTTHAAIGALLGVQFSSNPLMAFATGLLSHFLADIIPHGDSKMYKEYVAGGKKKQTVAYVLVDSICAIFFVLFLFNTQLFEHRLAISMGIVGGVLPDFLVGLHEVFRLPGLRWFHRLHFFFHNLITDRKGDLRFAHGVAMQMVLLSVLVAKLV